MEIGKKDYNISYEILNFDNTDYLTICSMFFHSLNFLKRYQKKYNINIFDDFFGNIRYHESDIRLYYNINISFDDYEELNNDIKKINNNFIKSFDDILFYTTDFLKFIRQFVICTKNNTDFKFDIISQKSFDIIYQTYSEKTKNILNKHTYLKIYKQFTKSIFFNSIDKFFDSFEYALIKKIKNKYFEEDIKNILSTIDGNEESLNISIEIVCADIYVLLRMFVSEGGWKNTNRVENKCSKYSYPKNLIISYGNAHIIFFNNFIKKYWSVKPDMKITIDRDNFDTVDGIRCLNLGNYIDFFD